MGAMEQADYDFHLSQVARELGLRFPGHLYVLVVRPVEGAQRYVQTISNMRTNGQNNLMQSIIDSGGPDRVIDARTVVQ
jgi:hypothetical protein